VSPLASHPPLVGLAPLRAQLDAVVAGGRTAGAPWATGSAALDAALGGGIPRGRITEVVGALASGKTALLRQVVARVLHTGGWVAWIDARRTLAPAPFTDMGDRLVMVRPRDGQRSAWCADLLLRSGVFALVIIDGAPALSRVHGVRLAQLARERDAACVVLTTNDAKPSRISGAVRLRLESLTLRRQRDTTDSAARRDARSDMRNDARGFAVIVEKGGPSRNVRSIEVSSGIVMARRVCTDSEIPDRRGVARGTRRPWAALGGTSSDHVDGHPITWGGLSVASGDAIYTAERDNNTPSVHRDTTRAGAHRTADRIADDITHDITHDYQPPLTPRERERERDRFHREFDKHTRDWTRYRGRRRMAESTFGRPSRRERAREKTGGVLTQHAARYPSAKPALGRVAEGVGR
jgi:hypothetical protein